MFRPSARWSGVRHRYSIPASSALLMRPPPPGRPSPLSPAPVHPSETSLVSLPWSADLLWLLVAHTAPSTPGVLCFYRSASHRGGLLFHKSQVFSKCLFASWVFLQVGELLRWSHYSKKVISDSGTCGQRSQLWAAGLLPVLPGGIQYKTCVGAGLICSLSWRFCFSGFRAWGLWSDVRELSTAPCKLLQTQGEWATVFCVVPTDWRWPIRVSVIWLYDVP